MLPEHIGEAGWTDLGSVGPVAHDDEAGKRGAIAQELYVRL